MPPGCRPAGRPAPQGPPPRFRAWPGGRGERRPRRAATMSACSRPPTTGSSPSGSTRCRARSPPAAGSPGDIEVDVATAGAGYTGLWTAYYLSRAEPGLRIAVCESPRSPASRASGRNGGWCSALFPASLGKLERMAGRTRRSPCSGRRRTPWTRSRRPRRPRASTATGPRAGRCSWPARPRSLTGQRRKAAEAREFGFGSGDLKLLTAAEATQIRRPPPARRRHVHPAGAAIHPARLVRGLAEAVRRRGVTVFERTPVTAIEPGRLVLRCRHGPGQVRHPRDGGLYAAAARPAARDRARCTGRA